MIRTAHSLIAEICNRRRNSDIRADDKEVTAIIDGLLKEIADLTPSESEDDPNGPDTMDIYSSPGTKVLFNAKGGHEFQIDDAKKILTLGETYTIHHTEVGSWSTVVVLEEFPQGRFNSVLFAEVR